MGWLCKKKIQKKLSLFLFSCTVIFGVSSVTGIVSAQASDDGTTQVIQDTIKAQSAKLNDASKQSPPTVAQSVASPPGACDAGFVECGIIAAAGWFLEILRDLLIRFVATPAATGFVWSVDPATMTGPSGTLNIGVVYSLWQFIRDFFNLFFILILLFSAFATIFQVDSFNIRNIFKNLLLVALFINFSFPITRFLIDAANVPMYYFINDVLGTSGTNGASVAMSSILAFSGISAGLLTNPTLGDLAPLLMQIIFIFLFSISLFVLMLMMIVRLIALTLLLIFSPVGFAASLIPGADRFGKDWWENFWRYALFGPAAGLMLLVTVKFLEGVSTSGVWKNMGDVAANNAPDQYAATLLTQVVFFCIPIILIWFTIGMAGKMSIAGAGAVVGIGYALPRAIGNYAKRGAIGTAKFAGRTALGTTKAVANRVPVLRSVPGAYAGVKEAFKGDGKLFGKQLIPKAITGDAFNERKEAVEARNTGVKGFVQGGRKGADKELRKLEDERVKKAVKENKEKQVKPGELIKKLHDKDSDVVTRKAAAISLAQDGEIRTATDLAKALEAVSDSADNFQMILDKAKPEAIGSLDEEKHNGVMRSLSAVDKEGKPVFDTRQEDIQKAYFGRLKKEGNIKLRLDTELKRVADSGPQQPGWDNNIRANVLKMSAQDLAKQSSLIQSIKSDPGTRAYFEEMYRKQEQYFEKIIRADDLKPEDMKVLLQIKRSVKPESEKSDAYKEAESYFEEPKSGE